MQVFDEIEEGLPAQRAEAFAAVRVEVHPVLFAASEPCD